MMMIITIITVPVVVVVTIIIIIIMRENLISTLPKRKHEKTQHALVGPGSAALAAAAVLPR